ALPTELEVHTPSGDNGHYKDRAHKCQALFLRKLRKKFLRKLRKKNSTEVKKIIKGFWSARRSGNPGPRLRTRKQPLLRIPEGRLADPKAGLQISESWPADPGIQGFPCAKPGYMVR
ncbi:MAG: hypothetical protein IJL98_05830, partial [Lachnospiraceae bacterium]|nr:hypothetical protein [Lachnospiraceae bacterium]